MLYYYSGYHLDKFVYNCVYYCVIILLHEIPDLMYPATLFTTNVVLSCYDMTDNIY